MFKNKKKENTFDSNMTIEKDNNKIDSKNFLDTENWKYKIIKEEINNTNEKKYKYKFSKKHNTITVKENNMNLNNKNIFILNKELIPINRDL